MNRIGWVTRASWTMVFLIGLVSTIGILYTFGVDAFSLKAVGLRGILVLLFCISLMGYPLFVLERKEQ